MRQLVSICLLVIFWGVLVQAKTPYDFIKDKIKSDTRIQTQALSFALQQRCHRYFNQIDNHKFQTYFECRQETQSFSKALDFQVFILKDPTTQESAPVTIAFVKKLNQLMNQVSTYYALSEIEVALQLSDARPFHLYKTLIRFFKNDPKAIEFLAVLFQDTTRAQSHIQYLKEISKNQNSLFFQNLHLLQKVHNQFFELQRTKVWKKDYQLYPDSVENADFNLSSTQYHFYVLSHSAIIMASEVRPKSADKIVFITSAFNYLYERFYKFNLNSAFNDQLVLPKKSSEDVSLGFLAALHGIGIHPESFIDLPDVRKNPQEFFRTSVKELKNYFP